MAKRKGNTGRGVTANMLDLGSSDSGFESQRPDKRSLTCEHIWRDMRLGFETRLSEIWDGTHIARLIQPEFLKGE